MDGTWRWRLLKTEGLIGCLNDRQVTSQNYKRIMWASMDEDKQIEDPRREIADLRVNNLEWHKFPDELPPHNADVLALTHEGELVRAWFMCIAYVECDYSCINPFDKVRFRIVENSELEPIFVPLSDLKSNRFNRFRGFHQKISHWCHLPNMPSTNE